MPAHVYLDHIKILSMDEINGAVRRMTRLALVLNVPPITDYKALADVLTQAGVPTMGSVPAGDEFKQLVLVGRKPKVLNDNTSFEVTLEYEHVLDGHNQNLSNPVPFGTIYGKTKCSVQQKTTNFYKKNPALAAVSLIGNPNPGTAFLVGAATGDRTLITVSHRYPSSGTDRDRDRPGKTETQGGEVTVYHPHRNFTFVGYSDIAAPWFLADNLIASINSTPWNNQKEGEWMCTEVSWEMARIKPKRYQFGFEFQHNPDGWDPTVVFIDERTGRPPPGLVKEIGYWTVPYHKVMNFNVAFNAFFEGWAQVFFPIIP